jgi:hypothetical protein
MSSNNASSADNQQERLIGWITGFVDGEGCFSIHFVKQPDRQEKTRIRRGYGIGYQIAHEFAVVQGAKSLDSLKELKNFFKVGNIYINRRRDNHKEDLYRYSVVRREHLVNVIIPFFEKYQLHTNKQQDFKLFAQCVRIMNADKHLNRITAIKIARMTELMNHRKSRAELIRILNDYTPSSALSEKI